MAVALAAILGAKVWHPWGMDVKKKPAKKSAQPVRADSPALERTLSLLEKGLRIDGLASPENRAAARWALGIAGVAMALRLIFWVYTQRYWEDSLITCLHSENFWLGLGLTHVRPGEPPLHGFTSPLSVLVPLIGDMFHVGFGLEFIKLVTLPAAAATVLYLMGIAIHPSVRLPLPIGVLVAGYAAVEHQQILFGMAAMETQIAVLVVVASLYHTIAWHPLRLGVWLGLCMLARPDFAFWCAIIGCYGLYRDWRRMPVVVGVAVAIYAPWILFTTLYYGTPVPNTMIAKSLGYKGWWDFVPQWTPGIVLKAMWMQSSHVEHITLGPTFKGHGTHSIPLWEGQGTSYIANIMFLFCVAGAGVSLWKRQFALWPLAAGALVYWLYYIWFVPVVVGWYMPPFVILLLLLAARGLAFATEHLPHAALQRNTQWGIAGAYLASFIFWLPYTFYAERQIQTYVENGVRKQAGMFMHEQMKPGEAVGCEPLGYMGYYSRGTVHDWPGLDSRKVVAWSGSVPKEERYLENMLKALQPEYLYLRDAEFLGFKDREWFIRHYRPLKQFRVSDADRARVPWIEANVDTAFWIYQKQPS
jgi:hypothetical protein